MNEEREREIRSMIDTMVEELFNDTLDQALDELLTSGYLTPKEYEWADLFIDWNIICNELDE